MVVVAVASAVHPSELRASQAFGMLICSPGAGDPAEVAYPQLLEAGPYAAAVRADQEVQKNLGLLHEVPSAVSDQDQESDEFVASDGLAAELVAAEPSVAVAEDGPFAEHNNHSTILHQHP